MLLTNTESNMRPSAVLLDVREDGTKDVRMANNIREDEREEQTVYIYDEAVFQLDADRVETAADIEADFDEWWKFGIQPEEPLPTLEERIAAIEDFLIGGDL